MRNQFEGDRLKCPTCKGSGELPGNPSRLRLAAFVGHPPARILFPKKRMPAKSGLEDHNLNTGIRLLNYTFGIIPAFTALIAVGQLRLETDEQDQDIQEYELVGARQTLEHARKWLEDLAYEPDQDMRWPGNPWYMGIARIIGDDELLPSFPDPLSYTALSATRFRKQPPANESLDRVSQIMVSTYRRAIGNLNDYQAWTLFKRTLIEWALGDVL